MNLQDFYDLGFKETFKDPTSIRRRVLYFDEHYQEVQEYVKNLKDTTLSSSWDKLRDYIWNNFKYMLQSVSAKGDGTGYYFDMMKRELKLRFGKGNYIIVSTSGGYHVLVKTNAIKANPHDFCKQMEKLYKQGVEDGGYPAYVDEKGNCKFECIVNDSQIPGIPLPGTFQYERPVTVLNKEDFE